MSITEQVIKIFKAAVGDGDGRNPEIVLAIGLDPSLQDEVVLKEEKLFDDAHRWFNSYEYIYYIAAENRWIQVDVGIGKTEYQDDEIWDAFEVRPQEKIITTTEYIKV